MVKVKSKLKKKLAELDYPCESSNQLDVKLHSMNAKLHFPMKIDVISSYVYIAPPKSPSNLLKCWIIPNTCTYDISKVIY